MPRHGPYAKHNAVTKRSQERMALPVLSNTDSRRNLDDRNLDDP